MVVKISFPSNIWRTKKWLFIEFYIHIDIDYAGIKNGPVLLLFKKYGSWLTSKWIFCFNFLRTNGQVLIIFYV